MRTARRRMATQQRARLRWTRPAIGESGAITLKDQKFLGSPPRSLAGLSRLWSTGRPKKRVSELPSASQEHGTWVQQWGRRGSTRLPSDYKGYGGMDF